ncbi:hypothetical protein KPL71_017359 [Citrus sinensis]|uniref:Uncharacterized protein n=2 Tax=Citrus sinensis TaxID=2711 RepID=A0ACB8JPB8_CITSI|nr:hypothetical protein KPL71_017359 [Citrus sinensis]KAH9734399.1 hypothetical protein KPL71_017359 [Citrus sinensis]
MFPGICFAIFFVLNALIWGEKSSGAVPFGTMFALVFLWFGISVPLVFVGSYIGFRKPAIEDPVKTNKIPRQIPEQPWYMNPIFSILIGGILPFGAIFIELFFILTSIWLHQFYYLFGFLLLVFLILIVTCAEITIVLYYFQLNIIFGFKKLKKADLEELEGAVKEDNNALYLGRKKNEMKRGRETKKLVFNFKMKKN